MNLFWHGRDLRVPDNRGLHLAARDDGVVPVYVYDTDRLASFGTRQRAFLMRGVRRLKEAYRERGGDLLVRAGDTVDVLADLVAEFDASAVYYNEDYTPARRNRQHRVERRLDAESVTDLTLVDPASLDERYENHSRFYDDWQRQRKGPPLPAPDADALVDVDDGKTPPVPDVDAELPEAGYRAAREHYDRFLDEGIWSYNDTRDDLPAAVDRPTLAVSRLSPYLASGMVGIREVWRDATEAYEAATGRERKNVDKYRYELSWREQNYHLLYHNPRLHVENYTSFPNEIAWRDGDAADADFEAWTRGETGYPLVDAGMRQLDREGYVHNRPRQVVASFLTKHLLIDWRRGARYFTKQLVDHDTASNYGNWQWVASTGTDSVDVRIFDPVSQTAKYDDGAAFVKQYVPELRDVAADDVVDWPNHSDHRREELAPDYPHPIVGRNEGYERAQRVFEEALGKR
ncbi:deoxyribodipyrimidine photo-lyase [Halobacteriales archaeon SW_5_70_135]|nr:MAG: deoxyribodipyrimidine photo-lyase [Halobacteriales archaeon SW_5_70_135]